VPLVFNPASNFWEYETPIECGPGTILKVVFTCGEFPEVSMLILRVDRTICVSWAFATVPVSCVPFEFNPPNGTPFIDVDAGEICECCDPDGETDIILTS